MISRKRWEAGLSAGEMIRSALHWAKEPERKARLYRVALVRLVWDELPWICRVLTELAERQADGEADPLPGGRTLEYIAEGAYLCAQIRRDMRPADSLEPVCFADYENYLYAVGYVKPPGADRASFQLPPERLCDLAWLAYGAHFEWCGPADMSANKGFDSIPLVRDIFGNPFRPIAFSPEWRTSTAVALAAQMYDARDFGAMPILADALQDAGCDSDDILSHCRDPEQVHVRGCWVVDLILGKQ